MSKNSVVVNLSGQEFRISGSENAEYIKSLEEMVNLRIQDVQQQYPGMSMNRCALLAMLNLEDELAKMKESYDALDAKIAQLREMPRVAMPVARATAPKTPVGV